MNSKLLIHRVFVLLVLVFFNFAGVKAQNASVKIDIDRKIGVINPDIYGAFLEPIRNIVYGDLYDPGSSFADENGFRKDLIGLIKELKVTNVRWPAYCNQLCTSRNAYRFT